MKLDFCPTCGAQLTALDATHYRCPAGHDYFNNPRAAVAVILVNDRGELLFAERARAPQAGQYDFPGGFVDFGETTEAAARRELQEELGVAPEQLELITTLTNHYDELTTTVDCVYLCRHWTGNFQPADDVASVAWRPLSFLRGPQFAWPDAYAGLADRLSAALTGR